MIPNETLPLTLPKSNKLHHRSLVEGLFASGSGVYEFPLRIVWRRLSGRQLEEVFCSHCPDRIGKVQLLITIPKKKRRHAVDRVLMRRRIREAFRLNRRKFENALNALNADIRTVSMAVIYQSNENLPYDEIESALIRLFGKILRRIERNNHVC